MVVIYLVTKKKKEYVKCLTSFCNSSQCSLRSTVFAKTLELQRESYVLSECASFFQFINWIFCMSGKLSFLFHVLLILYYYYFKQIILFK